MTTSENQKNVYCCATVRVTRRLLGNFGRMEMSSSSSASHSTAFMNRSRLGGLRRYSLVANRELPITTSLADLPSRLFSAATPSETGPCMSSPGSNLTWPPFSFTFVSPQLCSDVMSSSVTLGDVFCLSAAFTDRARGKNVIVRRSKFLVTGCEPYWV